jgi:hypothetical protein
VWRQQQGSPAAAARRRAKGLWGKLPAVLRYQRVFAFFVWSSKRSDWPATVSHPSPSVCCPGRHAYLGCIKPLCLPFLPRGATHFHAALLPVCVLQPMPLRLLVAVSCYLVVSPSTSCVHSSAASRRLHHVSKRLIILTSQPASRKFLLHGWPRRNRCPVAYCVFHTLSVGPTLRDNALQHASRFRDYNPMITIARYSSGDSVASGLSLCVLSR